MAPRCGSLQVRQPPGVSTLNHSGLQVCPSPGRPTSGHGTLLVCLPPNETAPRYSYPRMSLPPAPMPMNSPQGLLMEEKPILYGQPQIFPPLRADLPTSQPSTSAVPAPHIAPSQGLSLTHRQWPDGPRQSKGQGCRRSKHSPPGSLSFCVPRHSFLGPICQVAQRNEE